MPGLDRARSRANIKKQSARRDKGREWVVNQPHLQAPGGDAEKGHLTAWLAHRLCASGGPLFWPFSHVYGIAHIVLNPQCMQSRVLLFR